RGAAGGERDVVSRAGGGGVNHEVLVGRERVRRAGDGQHQRRIVTRGVPDRAAVEREGAGGGVIQVRCVLPVGEGVCGGERAGAAGDGQREHRVVRGGVADRAAVERQCGGGGVIQIGAVLPGGDGVREGQRVGAGAAGVVDCRAAVERQPRRAGDRDGFGERD